LGLLALFYQIVPYEYWYIYLVMAVIAAYLVCIYLNDIIKLIKRKKIAST
jgi:hypothetical protein